jgi:hypothetical protein
LLVGVPAAGQQAGQWLAVAVALAVFVLQLDLQ